LAHEGYIPTLLIDGYGFVFRAYHVQPALTSPTGEPVGALYGFTSMLLKLISDFRPVKCAVVFDGPGKNFRHRLYPEYKAHRPPVPEDLKSQLPLVRDAAKALNFHILELDGTEADDVIATVAKNMAKLGEKIVIVSSDKDLMQLIDDNIIMYDPIKAKYIDSSSVFEKFGVGADKVRDVLALMGDSSDNIPGAPGIGPKSAAELIEEFNSLSNLLISTDKIKQDRRRQIIETHMEQIKLSWELVGLKYDLDIANGRTLSWNAPERHVLSEFITKYGFKSLISRAEKLFGMDLEHPLPNEQIKNIITKEINDNLLLKEILKQAKNTGFIALYLDENKKLNLAIDDKYHYIINEGLDRKPSQADLFSLRPLTLNIEILFSIFADASVKKIIFDLKKHMHFFKGLAVNYTSKDPAISKLDHSLRWDEAIELEDDIGWNGDMVAFEDLSLMHYATTAGLNQPNLQEFCILNPITNFITTYHEYLAILKENSALSLYYDIDLPICSILYDMEVRGVKIDQAMLASMSKDFGLEIKILEGKIFTITGSEFNIGSPKQLGEILFEKMQLPAGKISTKSKTYSTGVEVLENLSEAGFEIADLILRWRALTKLKTTYTDSLPKQINPATGRVHSNFTQNLTSTSRLSSQDPNLQNIPIRSKEGAMIRKAFIADKDSVLISADYSQIELRLLSHIADVPALRDAFNNGLDIHSATASEIFHVPISELTSDHRRKAKAINFGIIYGISAFGLGKQLDINAKDAGKYIELYFEKYPGIKQYMDDTKKYAHEHGYVVNIFLRKCRIPLINNKSFTMKSFSERAAINAPLQSANADIIKIAMIRLSKILKERGFKTVITLQVHDELVFEAPKNEVDKVIPIIKQTMQDVIALQVPLTVDIRTGNSWGEME
jgi:DNA polymerase-1